MKPNQSHKKMSLMSNNKHKSRENGKTVKLLTFNTWGLKYLAKFRKERLRAIADRLANPTIEEDNYDIVAFQELWCEEDWQYLNDKCKKLYKYRRMFKSGIISGPGLAIMSKIPIEETFLYRFPINGRLSAFFRGDWYVGKSIGVTLLKPHAEGAIPIAILNSHMHAPYGDGDSSYSCHRACQAWDFTKIVNILRKAGYAVIQVGDLNSQPDSLPYKLFTIEGGLTDSWTNLSDNSFSNEVISKMDPQQQIELGGVTCDSVLNTWRAERKPTEACRLDYALIDGNNITPISASVKFTERLPLPYDCSYSDHFAYSAEFLIGLEKDFVKPTFENSKTNDRIMVYRELISELEEYQRHTIPYQSNWRKWHFFISLIFIFINIAISFVVSGWFSPLVMLFNTINSISGVINGLIWFFGVRSEHRALQEVQQEVEDIFLSLNDV